MFREAVEVKAVIPVCTSDKRELMRPFMIHNIIKGALKVFHKRLCFACIIVKRNHFIEYGSVACLTDICTCSCDKPERVIVKAASDVGIAFLSERLVLMVCASVFKLCRCNIDNSFSCAVRYEMNEA